jgi:hypothetical protein
VKVPSGITFEIKYWVRKVQVAIVPKHHGKATRTQAIKSLRGSDAPSGDGLPNFWRIDMVHTEDRAVYGKIYTQGLAFDLLDLAPQKRYEVPAKLRDGVSVFLVADVEGVAKVIWVSHWSGFVIVPFQQPELKPINFDIVEGEDEETQDIKQLPIAE